jgi:hypothetical protein
MATYQSVQSASVDDSNILVIAKPSGLAVGDLLVAGIWADRDGGSDATISTPAGWTSEANVAIPSTDAAIACFTKVADSSDVAASDFTFTGGGSTGSMHMIGHLLHVTTYGNNAGVSSASDITTSATLTITSFTPSPAIAEALYVVFAGRSYISTAPQVTAVSMATSNPTWTERAEVAVNGSTTDSTFAVYTANRTQTTATGNFTVTFANTNNTRTGGIAIAFNPSISGSITDAETRSIAYTFTPIQSVIIEAEVNSPETASQNITQYTNTNKPSETVWINTNK